MDTAGRELAPPSTRLNKYFPRKSASGADWPDLRFDFLHERVEDVPAVAVERAALRSGTSSRRFFGLVEGCETDGARFRSLKAVALVKIRHQNVHLEHILKYFLLRQDLRLPITNRQSFIQIFVGGKF